MPQPALVEPLRRWDPEQVGGFALIGRLGAGAMGQVYLGRSAAGRLVAIKTIKSELAEEPDFRTRFGQEVAAARRVSGAFTAAVIAADSEADVPWLATVYVPAPSLSRLVRTCGPLPVPAVRWLAAGCAEALEAIHGVGLVHRDLKPSNVLVSPDGPRVIDFGVARAAERIQLTVTRGSVGTPAYMAPEQARDTRQATPASDIFSLGATVLFAATGHAPYEGETVIDVLVRLATEAPDLGGLPPELTGIVTSCLERDPRNRPTSASIVARLAGSGDLDSAPLPAAALELIGEFRRAPGPGFEAAEAAAEAADESTLGSQPVLGGSGPYRLPGTPRAARSASGPGSATGPDSAAGPEGASTPGGRGAPGASAPARRPQRRLLAGLAAAVVAVALTAAGWAVGTSAADSHHSAGSSADRIGPVIEVEPPGPGAPPGSGPPPSGAPGQDLSAEGKPSIALNQGTGDGRTIFVIHGWAWPADELVTVTLIGVGGATVQVVVDGAGTFNFAINQGHEFFAGLTPPGYHTVRVTDSRGASAKATFDVTAPPK